MSEELPPSERPPESRPPQYSWEDEKAREKEAEKTDEKGRGYEEKYRRDPLSAVFWAAILIMAGLVFLANNMGFLPELGSAEPWDWIFFGAGALLLIEVLVRVVSPDYARPVTGRIIFAGVLLAVGLSGLGDFEFTWPLILVLIGFAILANTLLGRK